MALKKSEIYSTLTKCTNKLRSNSGIGAESFKNYVLILLFLKYVSDKIKSGEPTLLEVPDGCTFDDIIALKGKKEIGDSINKIIGKIADRNGLHDIINLTDHDFCDKKLGSADESSKLISELVAAFQDDGLDFSQNRAADDDLIGDAYEFLMRNFASQAGKDKGQFYTPTEVSRLIAQVIGIDLDERPQISAYDPTCGSGSLLLRVRAIAKNNVSLDGQDIDPANIELSYLNMFIHGCETADIRVGDTLNSPKHVENGKLRTYDYVVSNPKFSLHNWMNGAKEEDQYGRWSTEIGVPPQQYGDFAFLMHCVKSLKHDGVCAIILPNGVLTRGGDEAKLRKWLVEQRLLSGIIAFPANAFFGTSIAGNVLVIDKKRRQDGVFFIDASELGYKDADSKIRLREQDIKRVTDVWRARKNVPFFAYLATFDLEQKENETVPMYEIERNGYALNLSLYVTPRDKEIHQNIEAHLHGSIPDFDVERMQQYWDVCEDLKYSLFSSAREAFVNLAVPKEEISKTIEQNKSFQMQADIFTCTMSNWCKDIVKEMECVDIDNDPKSLIALWSQNILDTFKTCHSLVDAYDVYEQLMRYYNEHLQDDLYMISRDGWMPKLIVPVKKNVKWTDLHCDLLPVELAIKKYIPEIKAKLDEHEANLVNVQDEINILLEDNEEDFQEQLFGGKLNAKNIRAKLVVCSTIKLSEDDVEFLQSLMPYFEKNNKSNKEVVARICSERKDLFGDIDIVTKKVVNTLLKESEIWQYSTSEQRELWSKYLNLLDKEAELKKAIKDVSSELLEAILKVYKEMTAEKAKPIVIHEKWLANISERISKEMESATHNISADICALAERYENTLGTLHNNYIDKENAVLKHLQDMGYEL